MACRSFYLPIPIYNRSLLVMIGRDRKAITSICNKHHRTYARKGSVSTLHEDVLNAMDRYDGLVFSGVGACPDIMWLCSNREDILLHELFHVVALIMRKIGVKLTEESEEAYAYLNQYLFNEVKKKW